MDPHILVLPALERHAPHVRGAASNQEGGSCLSYKSWMNTMKYIVLYIFVVSVAILTIEVLAKNDPRPQHPPPSGTSSLYYYQLGDNISRKKKSSWSKHDDSHEKIKASKSKKSKKDYGEDNPFSEKEKSKSESRATNSPTTPTGSPSMIGKDPGFTNFPSTHNPTINPTRSGSPTKGNMDPSVTNSPTSSALPTGNPTSGSTSSSSKGQNPSVTNHPTVSVPTTTSNPTWSKLNPAKGKDPSVTDSPTATNNAPNTSSPSRSSSPPAKGEDQFTTNSPTIQNPTARPTKRNDPTIIGRLPTSTTNFPTIQPTMRTTTGSDPNPATTTQSPTSRPTTSGGGGGTNDGVTEGDEDGRTEAPTCLECDDGPEWIAIMLERNDTENDNQSSVTGTWNIPDEGVVPQDDKGNKENDSHGAAEHNNDAFSHRFLRGTLAVLFILVLMVAIVIRQRKVLMNKKLHRNRRKKILADLANKEHSDVQDAGTPNLVENESSIPMQRRSRNRRTEVGTEAEMMS